MAEAGCVRIIDQTRLPLELRLCDLRTLPEFCQAIAGMQVRGAPLIGITGAYGLALALAKDPSAAHLDDCLSKLAATRPTAVNLAWALQRVKRRALSVSEGERAGAALAEAHAIAEEDIANCQQIGEHGLEVLAALADNAAGPLNVMTHCNAGRLATLEWGTATAPLYLAAERGLDIHVWVSETRPRNQGASLTTWELSEAGIPCTVIADSAAGALMQAGRVDCCLVGSDRTAANGDVCNKIGTYLKALAARAHDIPFYVALPLSTIDWDCADGSCIPIEERAAEEVLYLPGGDKQRLAAPGAGALNPAFDVTPAWLVTALVTEAGVVEASEAGVVSLRISTGNT